MDQDNWLYPNLLLYPELYVLLYFSINYLLITLLLYFDTVCHIVKEISTRYPTDDNFNKDK